MSVLDHIYSSKSQSYELATRDRKIIARSTTRIPIVIESAYQSTIVDADGRKVIDLTSGWNVTNTGWNHPHIIESIKLQLGKSAFAPPWCTHKGRIEVAERINELINDGEWKFLCVTTGSEAVEGALKIARRATGRQAIVGFDQAYHGCTLGAMMAGGVPFFRGVDLPITEFHRHIPIPDLVRGKDKDYAELAKKIIMSDPLPAAVLLEPIFTNPGVLYGDLNLYQAIADACKQIGALIISDEVGTGFGRTGQLFGFQNWSIKPDILCVAKAITSGAVPMAGVIMQAELAKAVAGPGFSSTFGWTPLACAAANATLDVLINENLVKRSATLGTQALEKLKILPQTCKHVAAVRGKGLEIGIELVDNNNQPLPKQPFVEELTKKLLSRGIFLEPSAFTSTLLIMPPLVIEERQFNEALDIIIEEVSMMKIN